MRDSDNLSKEIKELLAGTLSSIKETQDKMKTDLTEIKVKLEFMERTDSKVEDLEHKVNALDKKVDTVTTKFMTFFGLIGTGILIAIQVIRDFFFK